MYKAFILIPKSILILVRNKKSKLVSQNFIQRLHLVVTEVNGCPVCSYEHTKMALKRGMSGDEISSFLSGENNFIKPEEAKAIIFAQHFADSRGYPSEDAYSSIEKEYGIKEAEVILSANQLMISGNMYGLPWSAFKSRLSGKTYKGSSLFYELVMIIMGFLFFPIAIVHGFLRSLIGLSNKKFGKS
jgi:AhpD family alkylhydroperoxidase